VTELKCSDDESKRELALADQRLRVDGQPRLTLSREDVLTVQVLMN
jgi:hypothetical protein